MDFHFEQNIFSDGDEMIERETARNNKKAMVGRIEKEFNSKAWEAEGLSEEYRQEALQIRDDLLEEEGYLPMSKDEFRKYFPYLTIRQGNTGICYNDAAIAAIAIHPNFELFVRASMKRGEDGSWCVSVPLLGGKNSHIVQIDPSDIVPQKNPDFSLNKDQREILTPADGAEGMRVLEALFTKIARNNNRLEAEGGFSDSVLEELIGNENFVRDTYFQFENYPPEEKIYDFFREYRPDSHIATAGSRFSKVGSRNESKSYNKQGGHAYAIVGIDRSKETVTIVNPHNTGIRIDLTWEEFIKKFQSVEIARINYANFLKNIKNCTGELL